jgi:hypothetical protein
MIRNLKALGLALIAVFALGAVVASAASAQMPGTLTSSGPVTLLGTQTPLEKPTEKNFLSALGGTVTCANAIYTGHKYNVTPHIFIPNDVSTVTITPHYGSCVAKIGAASFPATVHMNGCDYVFHFEGTTPGVDTYTVKATIEGSCTAIVITVFATAVKHAAGESFCNLTVTPNSAGYPGLHATDTTNGKIDITGTATGISVDKKSPTGSILCPEESTNLGTLTQDVLIEGKNEAGQGTNISLSHL